MLFSTENPPADAQEISLKEVDLSNPALDERIPIPNFSIRDYVFSARSKDIKTNWPFSQKNLQLCLNHGVRNLLPPFKNLDCVQNRSSKRDNVESSLNEDEKIINSSEEPSSASNNVGNIDISGSEGDKQLKYTANSHSQDACLKKPKKPGYCSPPKPETLNQPSMKKCKLIVKVGLSGAVPSSNKDVAPTSTCVTTVEPMTSKVCPVCKTFSSSSNTTLNAHIDQCLSMDSPIDSKMKPRVIKHKIKPKKMRSMADIYAVAQHCTLEELDRRNGRIWTEKVSLPTPEGAVVDSGHQEKRQSSSVEDKGDEGAVYIDANGTKLRILNKTSGKSLVSKLGPKPQLGKSLKGGKGSKSSPNNKKWHHNNAQKHRKYMKLAPRMGRSCSHKTRSASRLHGDQDNDFAAEENRERDENTNQNVAQPSKTRERIKSHNLGDSITKWVSSKRTALLKRRFVTSQSSVRDSYIERGFDQNSHNRNKMPSLSPGREKRMDNAVDENHEEAPLKKRSGVNLFGFQRRGNMGKFLESSISVDRPFSSKVTKLSSLKKCMLSVNRSSSRQPKSTNKRLFRVKNVGFHDYEKKHPENQSKIEDPAELSLKRSSILRIRKRRIPVSISRIDKSTDLKSGSELGMYETRSSPRVGADLGSGFDGVETQGGNAVIRHCSAVGDDGDDEKVLSLAKSFDHDFNMIGNTGSGTEIDYFSGVDPITIPGPPGSFLPSPGRMSSDEDHQGNSSLTMSQLQSSENRTDMVDRDLSNSPKSMNSTISNSMIAVSDSKSTERLSLDPCVYEMKSGFRNEMKFNPSISEKGVSVNYQDGWPCCCSRKEGVTVNYQEPQLLRRRVMSSFPDLSMEKEPRFYPIEKPNKGLNQMIPQRVNRGIFPSSGSDMCPVSVEVSAKPAAYGDFDSASPSSPNPILRLMGKNLMVVSNDENSQEKLGPILSNEDPNPRFETGSSHHKRTNLNPQGYNPIPMAGYSKSMIVNPFNSYQGLGFSPYRGSHMIIPSSASSQMQPPRSFGPTKWNCVRESSSNMSSPPSSIMSSSSTNRLGSSLHCSQSEP